MAGCAGCLRGLSLKSQLCVPVLQFCLFYTQTKRKSSSLRCSWSQRVRGWVSRCVVIFCILTSVCFLQVHRMTSLLLCFSAHGVRDVVGCDRVQVIEKTADSPDRHQCPPAFLDRTCMQIIRVSTYHVVIVKLHGLSPHVTDMFDRSVWSQSATHDQSLTRPKFFSDRWRSPRKFIRAKTLLWDRIN